MFLTVLSVSVWPSIRLSLCSYLSCLSRSVSHVSLWSSQMYKHCLLRLPLLTRSQCHEFSLLFLSCTASLTTMVENNATVAASVLTQLHFLYGGKNSQGHAHWPRRATLTNHCQGTSAHTPAVLASCFLIHLLLVFFPTIAPQSVSLQHL